MLIEIILPLILFILIVIFDATKDVLRDRFTGSFFDKYPKLFPPEFFNAALSWKNKWVLDENGNPKLDGDGNRIPKKWLGIDIPDAFTDGWHFVKFLLWTSLIILVALNLVLFGVILNFLLLSGIYLFVWWLFYDKLLLSKK